MNSSEECVEGDNRIIEAPEELDISSIPVDVIINILVRVPAKSLVRFKSASKAWLSLIHSAIFASTFNTHALQNPDDRYSVLVIAKDKSTSQCHFLSAPIKGGSTTCLFTIDNIPFVRTEATIIDGLVLFHRKNGCMEKHNFAFIVNPSTHEVMKLPGIAAQPNFSPGNVYIFYFFGFDPSSKGFKVLNIRIIGLRTPGNRKVVCELFDLSSCSWKSISPDFPFDPSSNDWLTWWKNVCIDGVIYIVLHKSYCLAAFDLREESFSLIPLPQGTIPTNILTTFQYNGQPGIACNYPYLINYNGLLAVVCTEKVIYHRTVEMWILQDKENQQWVKETVILDEKCDAIRGDLPRNVIGTGEIMFRHKITSKECWQIPLYDMNKTSFRFVEISVPNWISSNNIKVSCPGGIFSKHTAAQGESYLVTPSLYVDLKTGYGLTVDGFFFFFSFLVFNDEIFHRGNSTPMG